MSGVTNAIMAILESPNLNSQERALLQLMMESQQQSQTGTGSGSSSGSNSGSSSGPGGAGGSNAGNSPGTSGFGPQQLSKMGAQMSAAKTPSGALASGAGTLLGYGLGRILHPPQNTNPMGPTVLPGMGGNVSEGPEGVVEGNDLPAGDAGDWAGEAGPADEIDLEDLKHGGRVGKRKFALGGAEGEIPLPVKKAARGVLTRRPVLSTTIVITPVKKKGAPAPKKKARGGAIHPRKPAAVPPTHGPAPSGPPAPFAAGGRVQSPRGCGVARRGKRFSGIY